MLETKVIYMTVILAGMQFPGDGAWEYERYEFVARYLR